MSYLTAPRLTFAGFFQADVSTVNNDPRHFDIDRFSERFQQYGTSDSYNGWWNPIGTGIFRLADCTVQRAILQRNAPLKEDAVLSLQVGNAPDRPSGKIVDLDPDWQLASQLYGLSISLVDPASGQPVMVGSYEPSPFRDLWFSRAQAKGDSGASALFQSVLTDVQWDDEAVARSPFLTALRGEAADGLLSVRMTTYNFKTSPSTAARFCYGKMVGAIGPYREAEPRSFVSGRRFMPTSQSSTLDMVSNNGIASFSAVIDDGLLLADTSNALPTGAMGDIQNLGDLYFAVLTRPDIVQDQLVDTADVQIIGQLLSNETQQVSCSGIQALEIPATLTDLDRPLAVVQPSGDGQVLVWLRETAGGLDVRPEPLSFRLDPNDGGEREQTVTFFATCYGKPLAEAAIGFWVTAPTPDSGNTPTDPATGTTPTAPIPINNVPEAGISVRPLAPCTDAHGRMCASFGAPDVFGSPRGYIDGQVYIVTYNFENSPAIIQATYDKVSALVFSTARVPEQPAWCDVEPILRQYANLYPVMSQRLFDFADQAQADANARLLHFIFDKDITDPDYMPVTRDLSAAKRQTLLAYFSRVMAAQGVQPYDRRFAPRCPRMATRPDAVPTDIAYSKRRTG